MKPLLPETIQATRRLFADNALACAADARAGVFFVNDLEGYCAWKQQDHDDALAGKWDHTFTFRQRAHFVQYGEMVPLFAPVAEVA